MGTIEIKDVKGKSKGTQAVGATIAAAEPKMHLLHQAVVTEEANSRQGTQKTKTRSEVCGGGRKPYKQKKTGNARQGSTRSPQFAHGAMALAITPRDYSKKMNKRERQAAIRGALNAQVQGGNIIIVDELVLTAPKTKAATEVLKALGLDAVRRLMIVTEGYDEAIVKSFRNIPTVTLRTAPSSEAEAKTVTFSTRDVLVAHKILVTKAAWDKIEAFWSGDVTEEESTPASATAKKAKKEASADEPKPKRTTKKKAEEGEA